MQPGSLYCSSTLAAPPIFAVCEGIKKTDSIDSTIYLFCRLDGGLSNNQFICQLVADVTNMTVKKLVSSEMSSIGVAFVAGLSCGKSAISYHY